MCAEPSGVIEKMAAQPIGEAAAARFAEREDVVEARERSLDGDLPSANDDAVAVTDGERVVRDGSVGDPIGVGCDLAHR